MRTHAATSHAHEAPFSGFETSAVEERDAEWEASLASVLEVRKDRKKNNNTRTRMLVVPSASLSC